MVKSSLVATHSLTYNGRSFALIGFCRRLVCANLRKGCVSSLVIFSFLRWGAVGFYYINYQQVTK